MVPQRIINDIDGPDGLPESSRSAINWAPILGGALAAISLTLILLSIGSGLGFASMSPWDNEGASAKTLGVMAIVWLIIVQWFSSGVGGYLTGRLRTKWVNVHTDEVFFRDTAHGFLAWALGTIIVATLMTSSITSIVQGGLGAVKDVTAGAAQGMSQAAGMNAKSSPSYGYDIDRLFRSDATTATKGDIRTRQETNRILVSGITDGNLNSEDRAYLNKLIVSKTGITQQEADQRTDQLIQKMQEAEKKAKEMADEARKTSMYISLFTALSLLIGAFVASAAAALGGRHRDE